MDTRDGLIYLPEEVKKMQEAEWLKEMKLPPTVRQLTRRPPRVGKYDPCPCDSGKKFKWCCWDGKARRDA